MKTKLVFILGIILIAGLSSCKKDETNTTTDTFTRNDYVGSWSCVEGNPVKGQNFDCSISLDPIVAENIKISNFANLQGTAFAIVSGKNLVIPKQTINNNTFAGYGTMGNLNFITFSYYVKDNVDSLNYNATFNRK